MKKLKQITALIGVIALVGLYVSTLVLALIGSAEAINLLKVAVYATIVLPVLLWAYSFIYRLLKGQQNDDTSDKKYNLNNTKSKTPSAIASRAQICLIFHFIIRTQPIFSLRLTIARQEKIGWVLNLRCELFN